MNNSTYHLSTLSSILTQSYLTDEALIMPSPLTKTAEDLGYQDMYLYQCVQYDIKAKLEASLNDFLNSWLQHCLYQFERNKNNNG